MVLRTSIGGIAKCIVKSTRVYLRSTRCRGAGPCVNFRSETNEVRHFIVFTRMEQFVL